MNIIKLFKFSFFFVLNCFLGAMSLELKNSIDVYEDLFSKFSIEDRDMQKNIDELLNHLNTIVPNLKTANTSQSFDSDNFSDDDCCDEIDDISS